VKQKASFQLKAPKAENLILTPNMLEVMSDDFFTFVAASIIER